MTPRRGTRPRRRCATRSTRSSPRPPRAVAATHRDIASDGSAFRRDLFFRLAGVVVAVPAPAPDDVAAIVRSLFARGAREGAEVPPESELARIAEDAAARARPGGARALRQCVDRCVQMRDPSRGWAANWADACAPSTPAPPSPPPSPPSPSPPAARREVPVRWLVAGGAALLLGAGATVAQQALVAEFNADACLAGGGVACGARF